MQTLKNDPTRQEGTAGGKTPTAAGGAAAAVVGGRRLLDIDRLRLLYVHPLGLLLLAVLGLLLVVVLLLSLGGVGVVGRRRAGLGLGPLLLALLGRRALLLWWRAGLGCLRPALGLGPRLGRTQVGRCQRRTHDLGVGWGGVVFVRGHLAGLSGKNGKGEIRCCSYVRCFAPVRRLGGDSAVV